MFLGGLEDTTMLNLLMRTKPLIKGVLAALGFVSVSLLSISEASSSELRSYGSFLHVSDLPQVLFLIGEIESGDQFRLREAMRDHEITTIVTASPGGNVMSGLQIAGIVNDLGLSTYIPAELDCVSACSYIFLAGQTRLAAGRLGVHQFFFGDGAARGLDGREANSIAQHTAGEIIGNLSSFDVPPFVLEKMLKTSDMYYFSKAEMQRITRKNPNGVPVLTDDIEAGLVDLVRLVRLELEKIDRQESSISADTRFPIPEQTVRPPIAPPPQVDNFQRFYDTDFFGNDMFQAGVKGISLDNCEAACRSRETCVAYTYIPETRWCWPKYAVGARSFKSRAISGIITRGGAVAASPMVSPFQEYTAATILGHDILPRGVQPYSLDQCRTFCASRPDCFAFSWVRDTQWCWIKSSTGSLREEYGTITGVKK